MKQVKVFSIILVLITSYSVCLGQNAFSSNRSVAGMEFNILFNAENRYTVTQSGGSSLPLATLFDGILHPSYSSPSTVGPTPGDPYEILIEGLPGMHTQAGAWIGWTTRYWPATKFKIEGYNTFEYYGVGWKTFADYSNTAYTQSDFYTTIPKGVYTKIKITVYEASGTNGRLGISELFFIHPEAKRAYSGILPTSMWEVNGNVGIGVKNPGTYKLAVKGKIRAEEVKVETGWSDFVFEKDYDLKSLQEVEDFINQNKHLPDIPSAKEVEANGVSLGEMQAKLLQKVEELTLYVIEQNKEIKQLKEKIVQLENN